MLFYIGRAISRFFIVLFGRLKVFGQENVPRTGGVMLVANHISYIDPPLVGVSAPRAVWFMGKSELFDIPVLGTIVRETHTFPVKRGAVDRKALNRANELLKAGEALTVFIEGTRSPDGKLQQPQLGAAMIALRAGVPIVPVALIDSDRMLPLHSVFFHFSRVRTIFGTPITFPHLAGKHDRAALLEVTDTVMRAIARLLVDNGAADRVPAELLEEKGETTD